MTEITSYGSALLTLIKERFGSSPLWKDLELQCVVFCSRIPNTTNRANKIKTINTLKELKIYLQGQDINKQELEFIDEELNRYESTIQRKKYEEKDDLLQKDITEKYARIDSDEEGCFLISQGFNFEQSQKLSQGVYNINKMLKFYITPEITIAGKIMGEISEYVQEIPIITLCQGQITENKDVIKLFFFGEKINNMKWVKIREMSLPFYLYRFVSDTGQEYIMMSPEAQNTGDYTVSGMTKYVDDLKNVTDSAKLTTKLPYLFTHTILNKIVAFSDTEELLCKINQLNYTPEQMYEHIFSAQIDKNKTIILKHPQWFKKLIWAWLLHSKQGVSTKYPLHIYVSGNPGSGKSFLMNTLHSKTMECRPIFSGSSSTLKDLIISFKNKPPKLGYLAESNRFAFLDEFLRCMNRSSQMNSGRIDEEVALMNDLLEHQKRRAGSGIASVPMCMSARVLSCSNPGRELRTLQEFLQKIDPSWLSRWLFYFQPESHVKMIRDLDENDLETTKFKIGNDDFASITDYLWSFNAEYDDKRVKEIYKSPLAVLSEDLLNHYTPRHKHHIKCLIDGIIKTRCLINKDMNFIAIEQDYIDLQEIWSNIIRSWINFDDVSKFPIEQRVLYIPENAQFLYKKLKEHDKPLTRIESWELVENELSKTDYNTALYLLIRAGLIVQTESTIIVR